MIKVGSKFILLQIEGYNSNDGTCRRFKELEKYNIYRIRERSSHVVSADTDDYFDWTFENQNVISSIDNLDKKYNCIYSYYGLRNGSFYTEMNYYGTEPVDENGELIAYILDNNDKEVTCNLKSDFMVCSDKLTKILNENMEVFYGH